MQSEGHRPLRAPAASLFVSGTGQGCVSDLVSREPKAVAELQFEDFAAALPVLMEEPIEAPASVFFRLTARELEEAREMARVEGYEEARRQFGEELLVRVEQERERVELVRAEFARDRQRFFASAESQVVQLALAVARRVLARDADVAGLPLRSTVKAALARVQDGSRTVLRVPVEDQDAWRQMFAADGAGTGSAGLVEVVPDSSLDPGECRLETGLGRVELGVAVQLEEIERGFRELMQNQEGE